MENTEWFYKYHENQMTESEFETFQSRLKSDPDFKHEFDIFEQINLYNDTKTLKLNALQTLKEVNSEYISNHNKPSSGKKKYYFIILTVVLLAILGYYLFKSNTNQNTEQQYASIMEKYFQPDPISLTEKSIGNHDQIEKAVEAFNLHKYNTALSVMSKIDISIHEDKAILLLMKGISLAHENKCQEAISLLDGLSTEFDMFSNDSNYYIALCNIKSSDYEAARKTLLKIPIESNIHDKAALLLKEIAKN